MVCFSLVSRAAGMDVERQELQTILAPKRIRRRKSDTVKATSSCSSIPKSCYMATRRPNLMLQRAGLPV